MVQMIRANDCFVLQRLQGEVFLFMDMCGSLLATLRL